MEVITYRVIVDHLLQTLSELCETWLLRKGEKINPKRKHFFTQVKTIGKLKITITNNNQLLSKQIKRLKNSVWKVQLCKNCGLLRLIITLWERILSAKLLPLNTSSGTSANPRDLGWNTQQQTGSARIMQNPWENKTEHLTSVRPCREYKI